MYQSRCVSGDNPWDKALPPLRPIELETEIEKIKAYDSPLGGNPQEHSYRACTPCCEKPFPGHLRLDEIIR
jgi:hypothetical protein